MNLNSFEMSMKLKRPIKNKYISIAFSNHDCGTTRNEVANEKVVGGYKIPKVIRKSNAKLGNAWNGVKI